MEELAPDVGFTVNTIKKIEASSRQPPSEARLRIWLSALGMSTKLPEAMRLLRSVRRIRRIYYIVNEEVNEHIDRILDAYEARCLDPLDKDMLSMIALREYGVGKAPDPHENSVPTPAFLKAEKQFQEKLEMVKQTRSPSKGTSTAKNTAAAQLGQKGGKVGGPARAKKLSSQERSEIAKKGGEAKSKNSKKS